jgi:alpha- and gamma-adaptin-binding protein p34
MVPKILILGCSDVGKLTLASKILQSDLNGEPSCFPWIIDTKYYTAHVSVEICRLDACELPELDVAHEAVILVFDASSPESFTSLQRWWEGRDTDELAFKLAVATKRDQVCSSARGRPSWLQKAEEWCLERMIELVEVEEAEERPQVARDDNREMSGVARVVEALQAHMWSGLRLKPRQRKGAAAPSVEDAAEPVPSAAVNGGKQAAGENPFIHADFGDFGEDGDAGGFTVLFGQLTGMAG